MNNYLQKTNTYWKHLSYNWLSHNWQGYNYMDYSWLITFFFFSVHLSELLLIWNDLPLRSLKVKWLDPQLRRDRYITFCVIHSAFCLFASETTQFKTQSNIVFGFYHRQPNNKVSGLKTHDNKFVNSFFLLCLSLQIRPHLLLPFHHHPHQSRYLCRFLCRHQWYHLPHPHYHHHHHHHHCGHRRHHHHHHCHHRHRCHHYHHHCHHQQLLVSHHCHHIYHYHHRYHLCCHHHHL